LKTLAYLLTWKKEYLQTYLFFAGNYLEITALVFLIACITNPFLLITLIVCLAGGLYLNQKWSEPLRKVRPHKNTTKLDANGRKKVETKYQELCNQNREWAQYYIYGSIALCFLTGGISILLAISLSLLICLVHAALRSRGPFANAVSWADYSKGFGPITYLVDLLAGITS